MRIDKLYIALFGSVFLFCHTDCKKEYKPPSIENNPRLLVVDDFLTAAPDSTYITLTGSRNLTYTGSSSAESHATVVEESETTGISLEEIRPGVYSGLLQMDSTQKYRLTIRTNPTGFSVN